MACNLYSTFVSIFLLYESAFIKKNNLCIFPYQYTEYQNTIGEVNQLNFSDNIIIEDLANFKKKK